ncbi:MAG: hypothetical protein V7K90_20355 [Nostoc sp.]|uniref:hypothetical protein n=1 Tax=Nostoc sp. TaxID=1180 RepID=UPI002FF978BC
MQSNTQHKEYEDVDLELILRSGNSFLPAQKIKCSLFRIYSEPSSPYPGFSKYEAMARMDNRHIQELAEKGYPIIDPKSYASFIHEGITWDVYDSTMYQIKQENNNPNIDYWDYHLNKKLKSDEQ